MRVCMMREPGLAEGAAFEQLVAEADSAHNLIERHLAQERDTVAALLASRAAKDAEQQAQIGSVGYLVPPSAGNRGHLRTLRDMTIRALRLELQPHWFYIKV